MRSRLLCVVLLGLLGTASARAEGRGKPYVTAISRNDGDYRVGISTPCPSTSWNVVVSTRAVRRRLYLVSISGNGGNICLGTSVMASGTTCANATHGVELGTSATYDDYSEGIVTCRSRTGSVDSSGNAPILKGFEIYDSKD